jgi:hypothetical protein
MGDGAGGQFHASGGMNPAYPLIQRHDIFGTITVPLSLRSCSYQALQVRTAVGGSR